MKNMRKIYSFLVAAVAMITVASCAQEINNPAQNDGQVIFTAYADGAATKTILGENETTGKPLSMWNGEEWIQVVGKNNNYWMNTNTETPSASAMVYYNGKNGEFAETEGVFAVYPAGSEEYGRDGSLVTGVGVPTKQTATLGSYDPVAAAAIAYTDNNELLFKNITSLIKFQVATEGVKSVTFAPNGTENLPRISGKCSVSADGALIPWTTNEHESETYVELVAEDSFEVGKDYYIAIFPCTLPEGFKVEFSFDGSTKKEIKSYKDLLEIPRNQILNIGSLEGVAPVVYEWSVAGTCNNWDPSATPFVEDGKYWVAKNVAFDAAGEFKIVNNGSSWYKVSGFVLKKWGELAGGEPNVSIAAGIYDFYLSDLNLYVTSAGSAAPVAPGMYAAKDKHIYFKPHANWTTDNARFAIYVFGASGNKWVSMTSIGKNGIYEAAIPSGTWTNVIFCRMNPSNTANNWDNKWNQTGDLTLNVANNNYYELTSGTWDGVKGSWSKKTEF